MADQIMIFEGDNPEHVAHWRVLLDGKDVVGTLVMEAEEIFLADPTRERGDGGVYGVVICRQRHWETGERVKKDTVCGLEDAHLKFTGDVKLVRREEVIQDVYGWFQDLVPTGLNLRKRKRKEG